MPIIPTSSQLLAHWVREIRLPHSPQHTLSPDMMLQQQQQLKLGQQGCVRPMGGGRALRHRHTAASVGSRPAAAASQRQPLPRCWCSTNPSLPPSSVTDTAAADGPAPAAELAEAEAETAVRAGWDPYGLLPPVDGPVDHFARRARQRQQQQTQEQPAEHLQQQQAEQLQQQDDHPKQQADHPQQRTPAAATAAVQGAYTTATQQAAATVQQQQQQQAPQQQQPAPQQQQQQQPQQAATSGNLVVVPPAAGAFAPSDPVQRIPGKWLAPGGIPAGDAAVYNRQAFLEKLAEKFIPLDLDFPGVRIVNYDPAIFTVEDFMTPEECNAWQDAAETSGCLQQSKIGGGNAAAAAAGAGSVNVYGARRTSSSLLMDAATQATSPALAGLMARMQGRAYKLLAHLDGGRSWGPPGQMPAGGQYCFENPQVARYVSGQHFLAHEDGFPPLLAASNGFQRHATLLLYLNDVPNGGATHFDLLGISVRPRQGTALLFFPAYANGTPDARTLHTAQDAQDTKWVMQQWVARGYPTPKAVLKAVKVAALLGPELAEQPIVREVLRVAVPVSSSSNADGYAKQPAKGKRGGSKKGAGSKKGFSSR